MRLEDLPILHEFKHVFSNETPRSPLRREIDITIDMVLGAVCSSKPPYIINTPIFMDLKMHLEEILDKKYIRPSVSL